VASKRLVVRRCGTSYTRFSTPYSALDSALAAALWPSSLLPTPHSPTPPTLAHVSPCPRAPYPSVGLTVPVGRSGGMGSGFVSRSDDVPDLMPHISPPRTSRDAGPYLLGQRFPLANQPTDQPVNFGRARALAHRAAGLLGLRVPTGHRARRWLPCPPTWFPLRLGYQPTRFWHGNPSNLNRRINLLWRTDLLNRAVESNGLG
jgi:hypothetical protein